MRIVLLSPKGPLYRHRGGIFGRALRYQPLTLTTLAALAPERHKGFIYGAVAYFIVRAFDRVAFAGLLAQYSVGFMPNWGRIIVILLFAAGLLVFLPRQKLPSEAAAAPA